MVAIILRHTKKIVYLNIFGEVIRRLVTSSETIFYAMNFFLTMFLSKSLRIPITRINLLKQALEILLVN